MKSHPHDQSALFYGAAPRVAPKAKPAEPLWTLAKSGKGFWTAELRGHGEFGWELQILRDGDLHYGHRHQLRADAIVEGEQWRAELEPNGWTATR